MAKLFIFLLLWRLIGNPILAILVLLVILYFIDRRFIGLTPSLSRHFKRHRRLKQIKFELLTHPHNTSDKLEAAWLLIEQRKYAEALHYLEEAHRILDDSAEASYAIGLCYLKLGRLEQGEKRVLQSLEINPRVRYGEPYLRLGEALAGVQPEKAMQYLQRFREVHSSSCEAYYRLGQLYERMGRKEEARLTYKATIDIYHGLPKYKKRTERRFALMAWFKKLQS
ncbi:MAG: tetratricopeptide repeat protein [Paenibacillaceae bacterium]